MSDKIKICLVGGEDANKRIDLAKHLIQNGYDITILGTKKHLYPKNITFILYNLNRRFNPFSDIKTIFNYHKILKKNKFDIVQTFDTKPAFILPFATIGINTKIVRTITGLGTIFMSNTIKFKIYRSLYKTFHYLIKNKVHHTTFQNSEDRDYFLKNKLVNHGNSSLIYGSGIDLSKINETAHRKNKDFTFVCVARLVYEKGIVNYLEAAKICVNKGYGFKFLLIGPLEEESNRLNSSILKKYSTIVEWLGEKSNAQEYMLNSDAFVLPTFREGFSRVLLEASAIGLPMITTNVPGTKEIVRHNKEGLLVKPNNSEELANAMINMATNRQLANGFSKNARLHVKQFSLDIISNEYIKLYKKIA